MDLQSALNLIVLLSVIWIALRIRRRERNERLRESEDAATEAAILREPVRAAARETEDSREPADTAGAHVRSRASFGDRIFGGIAAGALIAALVFTLQVFGYGGPLSSLLTMALAALPAAVQSMDPLFAGAAVIGAASFVVGFLFPRLVVRIRPGI